MLRDDISLFYAARQSALGDPVIKKYLQCPTLAPVIAEDPDTEHVGIVEHYKNGNRILPAGTNLCIEGDTCKELYILLDGWVSTSRSLENGRQLILNFLLPGSFLGFQTNLFAPMDNSVQCLTEVVVCVFSRTEFTKLLEDNPTLALSLILSKAEDEKKMQDNLINIAMRPARARIAHFLLDLHARVIQAYPGQDTKDIYLPLTRQNIADTLSLSNVHVNRAIRTLQREAVVTFKKNRLRIQDFERLQIIAALSDG